MDRLTKHLNHPLDTFKRCQLCGYTNNDICEFRMWQECDENDIPEENNVFILCKGKCRKALNDHPRLYVEVPWSMGGPGKFMLTCGDCLHRLGPFCTNLDLKDNGGEGLQVNFALPMSGLHICYSDGSGFKYGYVATKCAGFLVV